MHIRRKEPKHHLQLKELKPPATIKAYRASMKEVRQEVVKMFRGVLPTLQVLINGATDSEGKLVFSQRQRVAQQAGNLIHSLFVGPDGRNAFAQDGVTALSPFAQILNSFYVRVTMEAIYAQRNWLKKNIPSDVFQWLARQRFDIRLSEAENPFLRRDGETNEEFMQRMRDLRIFDPNSMAEYDSMHTWVDPNGYELSQRIWNVANDTRAKIDALIMRAIAEGWSAVDLVRELEQYLVDGVGAYAALRLARTEIARAANQAAYMSAYLNPYVDGIDVARSPNGDRTCVICPRHATIGFGGERLRPSYSVHSANIPPYHSNDMCHVRPHMADDPATVTKRLQAVMQDINANSLPAAVTPANADAFTNMLLHRALGSLVGQFRGQLPLLGF